MPQLAAAPRAGDLAHGLFVRPGVRLAADVGSVRIGIARSDPGGLLASPLTTVRRGAGDLDGIAALAAGDEIVEVIVGLPAGLSGREGTAATDARRFAAALAARLAPVPVRLFDERFTTVIAHAALQQGGKDSRRRRNEVDQAAAALLLQGALDTERSTGRPPGELVGVTGGGGRQGPPAGRGPAAARGDDRPVRGGAA